MGQTAGHAERGGVLNRNNVTVAGASEGMPVLLAHGFGTSQEMWHRFAPGLAEHHPLVSFDHVGSGASDIEAYQSRRYSSLRGYAADVPDVITAAGLGPVHYVGHSAGGMIGALAAIARPELFLSLTLIGASPCYLDSPGYVGGLTREGVDELLAAMEANYLGWSRSLAPAVMGNPDRPELSEELAQSFARTRDRIAVDFARAIFLSDYRAEVGEVVVPTLILQASSDPMVPAEVGDYLHDHISGSRLVRLSATGHFPHISGPDETSEVVRQFLSEVEAGT